MDYLPRRHSGAFAGFAVLPAKGAVSPGMTRKILGTHAYAVWNQT